MGDPLQTTLSCAANHSKERVDALIFFCTMGELRFFLKWITSEVCAEIDIKCGSRMRLHESLRRDGMPLRFGLERISDLVLCSAV